MDQIIKVAWDLNENSDNRYKLVYEIAELAKKIVDENNLTCLMITHNMQSALDLGNRTFMMNNGNIVYDVEGDERKKLHVSDLLQKFKESVGKELDNDRMLLSE